MADDVFDGRFHLRRGPGKTARNEDRIVTEPALPFLLQSNRSKTIRRENLDEFSAGGHRHHADEAGLAAGGRNLFHPLHQFVEVGPVVLRRPGETGGANARPAAQGADLQTGILGDDRQDRVKRSLDPFLDGVGPEGGAVLTDRRDGGKTVQRDEADRRVFQEAAQLPDLVAVPGGEQEGDRQSSRPFTAFFWASTRRSMPFLARASIWSIWAWVKVLSSPVPCTSTRFPLPVITTFMSTWAFESSS